MTPINLGVSSTLDSVLMKNAALFESGADLVHQDDRHAEYPNLNTRTTFDKPGRILARHFWRPGELEVANA